jgi:hypothetical protein
MNPSDKLSFTKKKNFGWMDVLELNPEGMGDRLAEDL